MTEAIAAAFLLIGSLLMLLSAVGVVRLPDLFTRMHAVSKAGTTGVGFIMLAVICVETEFSFVTRSLMALLIVAVTAPVAAHMISRAAYIADVQLWEGTFMDELEDYYASVEAEESSEQ